MELKGSGSGGGGGGSEIKEQRVSNVGSEVR